ncbi:MAG: hypothetical protein WDO56_10205 [Gammaproteobacteria bacterium]
MIVVVPAQRERIFEHRHRFFEPNSMLAKVRDRFGRIPCKFEIDR